MFGTDIFLLISDILSSPIEPVMVAFSESILPMASLRLFNDSALEL